MLNDCLYLKESGMVGQGQEDKSRSEAFLIEGK